MLYINSITFSSGTTLTFDKGDIVVFVGANNVGKSATLKDVVSKLSKKALPTKVVSNVSFVKLGNKDTLKRYMGDRSIQTVESNGLVYHKGLGYSVVENNALNLWDNATELDSISPLFIKLLNTEQRLTAANAPDSINIIKDPPSHPIHVLQKNDKVESKFSAYFKLAFGQDLIVHRNAGRKVPLYVGNKPKMNRGEDRVSEGYLTRLEQLPLLEEQGDGMRSFVGVLLNVLISNQIIHLIDEPEAFLHPPQARLLGSMLGRDLEADKQLFISTHSEYFLKGLLDANPPKLKVVRIERINDTNTFSLIDTSDIEKIWDDSLLRHSNILDGLFHSQVILCESDSDCRFFSAIITTLCESKDVSIPDIHFVQSSGKHRFPTVINALLKLNVKLKVIGDIDLLNSEKPLRTIYESVGGSWSDIEKDFKIIKSAVDQKKPELLTSDLKDEINKIFDQVTDKVIPKEKIKSIEKLLSKASPWTEAKSAGRGYIPNGDASVSFDKILSKLEEKGIIILDVGELEAFDKKVGGHGPTWVNEVLKKDLASSPDLKSAREFVESKILK